MCKIIQLLSETTVTQYLKMMSSFYCLKKSILNSVENSLHELEEKEWGKESKLKGWCWGI